MINSMGQPEKSLQQARKPLCASSGNTLKRLTFDMQRLFFMVLCSVLISTLIYGVARLDINLGLERLKQVVAFELGEKHSMDQSVSNLRGFSMPQFKKISHGNSIGSVFQHGY